MSPYRRLSPQRENRASRNVASSSLRRRSATAPTSLSLNPAADRIVVLATDIVASTALGKRIGEERFRQVIAAHHRLLRAQIAACPGREIKETGDGFWITFSEVSDTVRCAQSIQNATTETNRAGGFAGHPLEIRMAIHVTHVTQEDGDYRGLGLHDVARLLSASNGGQVLLSEAAVLHLPPPLPDGIRIEDCGRYLLRDAPAPARLFEALWENMPGGSVRPAPVALLEREPRLPATITRFFGRESERERIVRLLEGEARLITLTGMGGSGKTRLAVEASRQFAPRFGGAVWFVPLAAVSDPNRILEAVRATVGVAESASGDGFAALDPTFSSRPCLLLLDNLEQLQASDPTPVDRFVQEALERYPLLVLLCTSRHRLGLPQEQEIALRPFSLPPFVGEKTVALEKVRTSPSVALFEDRARRARSDFAVTEENADAVVRLCRRLEGLPLALELAAAWARLFTPAEMLARVSDIRRGRDRDLPERHRSLQAVLESSYRLLTADQQRAFRTLSVFRGGWTLEAAERVCEDAFVLDLLADLSEHSLIVSDEREDRGSARFYFLESVREFAESCLKSQPDEAAAAVARHTAFFADLAGEAENHLRGPEQAQWLARLAGEHPNLSAALERADACTRVRIATRLYRYLLVRGHFEEGMRGLILPLDGNYSQPLSKEEKAKARNVAGNLAMTSGDLQTAEQWFRESGEYAAQAGYARGEAIARVNLAAILSRQKRLGEARQQLESSLPLWRSIGPPQTLAGILNNIAAVAHMESDFEGARAYLEEAWKLQDQAYEPAVKADIAHNIADVALGLGDQKNARLFLGECWRLRVDLDDKNQFPHVLLLLSRLSFAEEKIALSARLFAATTRTIDILGLSNDIHNSTDFPKHFVKLSEALGEVSLRSYREEVGAIGWAEISQLANEAIHPESDFPKVK